MLFHQRLEIVAGLNISNALCNLLNVVFVALGSAVGILIGQTLGASMYEKAKKDAFHLMWFTGAVSLGLTVILVCVSGVFPKLYDTTAQVQQYGQWFIVITALFSLCRLSECPVLHPALRRKNDGDVPV